MQCHACFRRISTLAHLRAHLKLTPSCTDTLEVLALAARELELGGVDGLIDDHRPLTSYSARVRRTSNNPT